MEQLESTQWLEMYLERKLSQNVSLDNSRYKEVRNFMLLWNIFERVFLNNNANAGRVWNIQNEIVPCRKDLDHYYSFLIKEYVEEVSFKKLNFDYKVDGRMPEHQYGKDVFERLRKETPSEAEKKQVCLMVLWRYRNNLFHGGKEISNIWKQGNIFLEANRFLVSLLSQKTGVSLHYEVDK
ncbi:MAG: hypothetical protein IJJ96_05090 [Bacteroidales bacterium]|nr:hypothetical protein [Bacteroidales bacterium]